MQVKLLQLIGTSLYPAFDMTLVWLMRELYGMAGGDGESTAVRLFRDRIHMSVCSAFCVFGFFYMLLFWRPADDVDVMLIEKEKVKDGHVALASVVDPDSAEPE